MAKSRVHAPKLNYSANDKRLITLLSKLLDETTDNIGNLEPNAVALSSEEAEELCSAVDSKLESKEFWQTAALVEGISQGNRESAREIYLRGRSRFGASRIMSSTHYHSFLARLGFERPYLSNVNKMEFEHFIRMERRVWEDLQISPKVIHLLERFLRTHQAELEAARMGKRPIASGAIIQQVAELKRYKYGAPSVWDTVLQTNRLAGALTLFTNMGVMFGTRDWSVTGTMSTLAASAGLVAGR